MTAHLALSALKTRAMSGTKGSSGLGSVSSEQIDNNTCSRVHHVSSNPRIHQSHPHPGKNPRERIQPRN